MKNLLIYISPTGSFNSPDPKLKSNDAEKLIKVQIERVTHSHPLVDILRLGIKNSLHSLPLITDRLIRILKFHRIS